MTDVTTAVDPDKFAALLCDWCLEAQPGEQILVESTSVAEPLMVALHKALLQRGAWPLLRMQPPSLGVDLLAHARPEQLDGYAPLELLEAQQMDASLRVMAPLTANPMAGIDPALSARKARAIAPLREARSKHRWALSIWPTPGLAELAGMPLATYAEFLSRALLLDHENPLQAWSELETRQARVVERLTPGREVRIQSAGTDLTLNVEGRTWVNSNGKRNMPSGEVFTSPHEASANGVIVFDIPSNNAGTEVSGVRVEFRDGKAVSARAEVGDEALQAALATDDGARFLGEIGIGTNTGIDRATGSTLLDEKIAGTIHLALGRSYPEAGGLNESALHWDLICDLRGGGTVTVDGEQFIVDGAMQL